jgi:membrane fusion protein (multidrug efflux system)
MADQDEQQQQQQSNGQQQSGGEEKKPPRPIALPVVVTVAIVAAVVVAVISVWLGDHIGYAYVHQTTDDAKVDADTIILTSKISERVARIDVNINHVVHRGDLLAELDDRDEQTRLMQVLATRAATIAQSQQAQQTLLLTQTQVQSETSQSLGNVETARSQVVAADATYGSAIQEANAANAAADQASAQLRSSLAALPGQRAQVIRSAFDLARDSALLKTGDVPTATVDEDRAVYESDVSAYQEAKQSVETARANLVAAKRRYQAQVDQADSSFAAINAQRGSLTAAQGRLAEVTSPYRIGSQRAALTASERQIRTEDAQVRDARLQLSYTRIYAPVDGIIAAKSLAVGQTVSPGTALFTLVPTNDVYVTANFKETQLDRMRAGEPVDIHVDAYPEYAFVGHVGTINPASQNQFAAVPPQNATGNFVKVTQRVPVRIYFDRIGNPPYALRPGMSVEASVRVR